MKFSLSIDHFKCLKHTEVSLNQLTVLAGANSVGKSSVVQALLLCRMVFERYREADMWHDLSKESFPRFPPARFSLNGPFLLNLGSAKEVLNRDADGNTIIFGLSNQVGKIIITMKLPADIGESYSLHLENLHIEAPSKFPDISLHKFSFYYLNAERIGPRIRHDVDDLLYPHAGWQGEFAVQVIGSHKSMQIADNRCFDPAQPKSLLQQTRLWLEHIAPGTNLDDANLIQGIKSAEVSLGGSKPTNVGFGISYILPIIVNGLISAEKSMFIVENPEAHLHPHGQSQIGKFLAKIAATGVQVVIETHSEHILNGIRIAALTENIHPEATTINFFHRDSDDNVQINSISINEAGDLSAYPKGFFDQEQRDMAEIVRQKRRKMESKP